MGVDILFQAVLSGLANGAVYALVAVGLTLVFGVMRVVNFAHGEFLMIAMYAGYFAWSAGGIDPVLAVPGVAVLLTIAGALLYQTLVRPLMRAPEINQMAVTLGLSLLLQNLALMAFAGDNRLITLPRSTQGIALGPAYIQVPLLIAAAASIVLLTLFYVVIYKTSIGLSMRAASQSRDGAELSGIPIGRIYLMAVALGIGALGVAGPLVASMLYVNPHVGELFTLKAFVIVILGGMGSFGGALLGAMLISLAESIAGIWLPGAMASAIPFGILILVMLVRPEGIFSNARSTR